MIHLKENTTGTGKIFACGDFVWVYLYPSIYMAGQQEPVDPNLCGQFSSSDLGVCVVSAVVNNRAQIQICASPDQIRIAPGSDSLQLIWFKSFNF